MKNYIQKYFREKLSYDEPGEAAREAEKAIPEEQLAELIQSMQARCQAVIDAKDMHKILKKALQIPRFSLK